MASTLGAGAYCGACFHALFRMSKEEIEAHKTEVRNKRSRAMALRWQAKKGQDHMAFKPVIVTLQYTLDTPEDAAKLLASLGGGAGAALVQNPGKPAKAPKEEPPAEEEEDEEEEDEEEEDEEEEDEEEDGDVPEIKVGKDLKNATKLREVLTHLMKEYEIKSKKKLTAAVLSIKDKVPVLGKLADLETRVPRAAELIDPNMKD